MTRPMQASIAWLAVLCGSAAFAQTPQGYPPPGNYLIDSEATSTMTLGTSTIERTERVVGSSGDTTVTQKFSLDGVPPQTQTYKGAGPNSWCIKPYDSGGPPPALKPFACKALTNSADARGSTSSADCRSSKVDESWRRIDDRTWERTLTITAVAGGATASPQGAINMVMAGMTPEQRAKAQTELSALPSAGQSAAAMAQLSEAMPAQARTGGPKEAALAEQQLQALRRSSSGSGQTTDVVPRLRERWTRVADTCAAQR